MTDVIKPLIGLAATRPRTAAEAEAAFDALFEGEATPAQMGGFLMALRTRGETVEEYAAAAKVMRAKSNRVTAPEGAMDIVGTGGDGKGTLNISTATAFVVAGAGVVAAKHGIVGLTKVTALENATTGVTCNAICPGWVLTPLVQKQVDAKAQALGISVEAATEQLLGEKEPSMQFTTPEELGALAVFLCSPAANNVRGVAWNMDGGWTAQ